MSRSYRPKWMLNYSARDLKNLVEDNEELSRSAFLKDVGTITHSKVFKRLAHKTQVHSMPENDHIRTRLTHSVEVSQIGRQIARCFCERVVRGKILDGEDYFLFLNDLEELTAAACYAHDIGHPPFGHKGKEIIEEKSPAKHKFDDNKQVVRVLLNSVFDEVMKPTAPLIASVLKKFGVEDNCYKTEEDSLKAILAKLELNDMRHPASFFMEAADDIAYIAADLYDYMTYFNSGKLEKPKFNSKIDQLLRDIDSVSPKSDLAKLFPTENIQEFSDRLIKVMLTHVRDVFDLFQSEKRPTSLDDIPKLLNEFIKENAHSFKKKDKEKFDYNLLYLRVKGNEKRGGWFFEFKKEAYGQILDDKFRAAQDFQAEKVLTDIWAFFERYIVDADSDALMFLPEDARGYVRAMIKQHQLDIARIDLMAGMTDRYATDFWESIQYPIKFRKSA